jgi:hypothetical protein
MTLKEKIQKQAQDTTKIYLHQEGAFYKVYNEGAFLFNSLGYKLTTKYIKNLKQEMYTIHFPLAVLYKIADTDTIFEEKNIKVLCNSEFFVIEPYHQGCKVCKNTRPKFFDLYDEVLNFSMSNHHANKDVYVAL